MTRERGKLMCFIVREVNQSEEEMIGLRGEGEQR